MAAYCAAVSLAHANQLPPLRLSKRFGHESVSCKKCYSKQAYWTLPLPLGRTVRMLVRDNCC